MGKYGSSGIDWIDITTLMSGLQGIHECNVELIVTTGTQGHNGLLNFTASAWVPTVDAHQIRTIAEVVRTWPNQTHRTFDSCVFEALYDLDREIGEAYQQERIEEA